MALQLSLSCLLLRQIPNLFTLLNLYCGVMAIVNVFTMNMLEEATGLRWQWSIALILIAAGFDFLDGMLARLLNAQSEVGAQLDSLADLVAFGVAPAMLLIDVVLYSHAHHFRDDTLQQVAVAIIMLIPLFAALRLAVFNVKGSTTEGFSGLPTPAMALVVLSVVATVRDEAWEQAIHGFLTEPYLILFVVALCAMMVLPIPLLAFKFSKQQPMLSYWPQLVFLGGFVAGIALLGIAAGLPLLLWYILVSTVARFV